MEKYTVNHNGTSCSLPTFTRVIKRKLDDVNVKISDTEITLDARIDAMYVFLSETLGEDALVKALGGADLDEIDLNDLNILYLKVAKEYDRPVSDFNSLDIDSKAKKMIQEIASMAKNVESIQRAAAQGAMIRK